jgi:hypothetical protein
MVRTSKPFFLRTVVIVLFLLVIEGLIWALLSTKGSISGLSIVNLSKAYSKFYPGSKIFLVVQWVIIGVILLVVYLRSIGIQKRNEEITNIDVSSAIKKTKTKLDAFYLILKERKKLSVKTLSDLFEISPDLAMEWARILESGNLVAIDYPGFGSPIVHVIEKKESLLGESQIK